MTSYGSPEQQCGMKRQYTKQEAKHAARRTEQGSGGRKRKLYKCPICHYWHVAHPKEAFHATH